MTTSESTTIELQAEEYTLILELLDVNDEGIISMFMTLEALVFGEHRSFKSKEIRTIAREFAEIGDFFLDHFEKNVEPSNVSDWEWLNSTPSDSGNFLTEDMQYRFRATCLPLPRLPDGTIEGSFELLSQLNVHAQWERPLYLGFESTVEVDVAMDFLDKLAAWLELHGVEVKRSGVAEDNSH